MNGDGDGSRSLPLSSSFLPVLLLWRGGWGWKLYNFAIRFEVVILTEASTNQVVIEELDILIINILDDRDSQGIEGGQSHLQLWPP